MPTPAPPPDLGHILHKRQFWRNGAAGAFFEEIAAEARSLGAFYNLNEILNELDAVCIGQTIKLASDLFRIDMAESYAVIVESKNVVGRLVLAEPGRLERRKERFAAGFACRAAFRHHIGTRDGERQIQEIAQLGFAVLQHL